MNAEIYDYSGQKSLILPTQGMFWREFNVGDWTELYIAMGVAVSDIDMTHGGSAWPPSETVGATASGHYFFGLKTPSSNLPGTVAGEDFWGMMSHRVGDPSYWQQSLNTWSGYEPPVTKTVNCCAVGVYEGTTAVAGGLDTGRATYHNSVITTDSTNANDAVKFQCTGNATDPNRNTRHIIRFKKVDATTINISGSFNGQYYAIASFASNDPDTLRSEAISCIENPGYTLDGLDIAVTDSSKVPGAFFVYAPWITARLRINNMIIFKNA